MRVRELNDDILFEISKGNLKEKEKLLLNILITYKSDFEVLRASNYSEEDLNTIKKLYIEEIQKALTKCLFTKCKYNLINFIKIIDSLQFIILKKRRGYETSKAVRLYNTFFKDYSDIFTDVFDDYLVDSLYFITEAVSEPKDKFRNLLLLLGYLSMDVFSSGDESLKNKINEKIEEFNEDYKEQISLGFDNKLNKEQLETIYTLSIGNKINSYNYFGYINYYNDNNEIKRTKYYTEHVLTGLSLGLYNVDILSTSFETKEVFSKEMLESKLINLNDDKTFKFLIENNLLSSAPIIKIIDYIYSNYKLKPLDLSVNAYVITVEKQEEKIEKIGNEKAIGIANNLLIKYFDYIVKSKKEAKNFLKQDCSTFTKSNIKEIINKLTFDRVNEGNKNYINFANDLMIEKLNE